MAAAPVTATRDGAVVTLVLDEPDRRNPLSLATMRALTAQLRRAGDDPGVRAVVIGASGHRLLRRSRPARARHRRRRRAAGDLRGLRRADARGAPAAGAGDRPRPGPRDRRRLPAGGGVRSRDRGRGRPVRDAGRPDRPLLQHARWSRWRARWAARARRSCSTRAIRSTPATAREWGLVAEVVAADGLEAAVAALAARIADSSRSTLAIGKSAIADNLDLPLTEAYAHASGVMCANAVTPRRPGGHRRLPRQAAAGLVARRRRVSSVPAPPCSGR